MADSILSKNNDSYESVSFRWSPESAQRFKICFSEANIEQLKASLNDVKQSPSQDGIDSICTQLNSLFISKAEECGICTNKVLSNSKPRKKYVKPWFDNECNKHRDEYYRVRNKMKFTNMTERTSKIKIASKRYKDMIKEKRKNYFSKLHKKLRNLKANNSKDYWNFLNKASRNDNIRHTISLEVLKDHFSKISYSDSNTEQVNIEVDPASITEDINMDFSTEEVKKIISKLKNGKACGLDHIRNEFLKNSPDYVVKVFVDMFNIILKTGLIPQDWCIGAILPLYKNKGDKNNPDNYRGITLLSCLGKLFTSLLNHRLTLYLENVGYMGEEQAGFKGGYSTMDHVFTLHSIIDLYTSRNMKLYCAFIDYRKAFHFVDSSSMWRKLISAGINGNILRAIYNLYEGAKSCVKLDGNVSEYFNCNIGVRQGENLSPLLFAIFLNDFEYSISRNYPGLSQLSNDFGNFLSNDDVQLFLRLFVLLYADDTIILAESAEELQKALDAAYKYCTDWKLIVNTDKTKIVIFSKRKVTNYPAFLFGHNTLQVVEDYDYLGVTFNYNGLFQKAIAKQIRQGTKAFYSLLTKIQKLHLPIDLSIELFNQLVLPVLLYGCEVWGSSLKMSPNAMFFGIENSPVNQIEILYRKFLKKLLGVYPDTPSVMVYSETGTLPIVYHIYVRMLCFYMRLVNERQSKLSVNMLNLFKKIQIGNDDVIFKWGEIVSRSFANLGMYDIWSYDGYGCSVEYVKLAIKLRLKDIFMQELSGARINHTLCHSYSLFKFDWSLESYLLNLSYNHRLNLCKFRCRSNNLPISQLKYINEDEDNLDILYCKLCRDDVIGDEYHYLLNCSFFIEERRKYIDQNYLQNINRLTFQTLMSSSDTKVLTNISIFSKFIMDIFDNQDKWDKD